MSDPGRCLVKLTPIRGERKEEQENQQQNLLGKTEKSLPAVANQQQEPRLTHD